MFGTKSKHIAGELKQKDKAIFEIMRYMNVLRTD